MFDRSAFLAIFTICWYISGTNAQDCIPNPVENIYIAQNRTLFWSPSENCPDTQYMVHISSDGNIQYEYTRDTLSLNVNFLKLCRIFTFAVTPFSNNILGMASTLQESVALPIDTDIDIKSFTASPVDLNILLQWYVDEQYEDCVMFYLFRRWEEDLELPEIVNVMETGFLLQHVTQCMWYRFEITAYYIRRNGTPSAFEYTMPEATNTPSLIGVIQDSTTINSTWRLEDYYVNRCPITALHVNSTHFNQTYPIQDSNVRPDIEVSVSGLRANTMYYFTVSTENSAGISNPVPLAVQTLPVSPGVL